MAINPKLVEAHNNLGNVLNEQGLLGAAAASFKNALALKPDYAMAYNNLGRVLKDQGHPDQALTAFRQALALDPAFLEARSNLLFTLNYMPGCSREKIYRESLQWGKHLAAPPQPGAARHARRPGQEHRLKIGYVSPDFRTHSVAYFIEPVLQAHNREKVKIYCYANVARPDEVTDRLRRAADEWVSIFGKSATEAAARIRQDGIDILVDLAGHTGGNSLAVFAARPAPVQVTWLGYPNTTGLTAMDYRLTDAVADPPGEADRLYSEKLIRLEHGFLCYRPEDCAPDVGGLPCRERRHVTFGNFNDLVKTNPETVKAWAAVLKAVPGSRLLMKAKQLADDDVRNRYLAMFAKEGVAQERVELLGRLPGKRDHLALYNRVDMGLDPFPYNGTTTTCEALWMGVPVITLAGDRHAGRVTASILHRLGLAELVAGSIQEYVDLAQKLAADGSRLAALRTGLRKRVRESGFLDGRDFAARLEEVYRDIWIARNNERQDKNA